MRHSLSIALGLLLMAGLAACHKSSPPPPAPRPVAVVAPLSLDGGALIGEAYPGSVRARVESPLSFRVSGKITERRADIGVRVKKGAVLAVLDPVDARLNVEASAAAVASAEADARLAESEYRRYQDLAQRGFASNSLLDQRRNQTELAQARVAQARSQLAVIRNQAGYTSLVADADGVITQILADAGQVVSAGQPVFGFARDGEREVRISVPEGAAAEALRKAPQLRVTLWGIPGKSYEAHLRELASAADDRTRTLEARISIHAPDDDVKLGMTATVLVGGTAGAHSWRLPLSAVGDQAGKAVIWRVTPGAQAGDSVAQALPVQVLQYLNDAAVITGDIKADDQVISAGVHLLTPGMAVKAIDRAAPVAL